MAIYPYQCNLCGYAFEVVQSMSQYVPINTCPNCNRNELHRVYEIGGVNVVLGDHEIQTIDHLAKRNTERFSDDKKADFNRKHNAYKHDRPGKDLPQGMSWTHKGQDIKWI